jgi:hypothetical protein
VEEFYGTLYGTKVAPFPQFLWGVVFHCLRSFFFLKRELQVQVCTITSEKWWKNGN